MARLLDQHLGESNVDAIAGSRLCTPVLDVSILESLGSDSNWGLLPAHRLGSTLRRTQDGRVLVRSYYGYEREAQTEVINTELRSNLLKRFPQLEDCEFESIWGGAVGFTLNGGAYWGEKKPGLLVSAGCNGGGVVKGTLFGEILADLAHGREVPDIPYLFNEASWIPPEPFRALGFQLISAIERFRGRAEI